MTDTTDDMRTWPDYEAEAYRLRGRVAELEARVLELEVDNDGLRAEMAREVEVNASSREKRGKLETENAIFKRTIDELEYMCRDMKVAADSRAAELEAENAKLRERYHYGLDSEDIRKLASQIEHGDWDVSDAYTLAKAVLASTRDEKETT